MPCLRLNGKEIFLACLKATGYEINSINLNSIYTDE